MMPIVVCRPVMTSKIATPARKGEPSGFAGDADHPAHRLDEQVVAGQGIVVGAETGDRGVDDLGIGVLDRVVVEAELLQPTGFEVLNNDVGPA